MEPEVDRLKEKLALKTTKAKQPIHNASRIKS